MTPERHRAAALLGQGWTVKDVAAELGATTRTITRWRGEAEFERAELATRRRHLESEPDAYGVLKAALGATLRDGRPDWQSRLKAASILFGKQPAGATPEQKVQTAIIFTDRLADA